MKFVITGSGGRVWSVAEPEWRRLFERAARVAPAPSVTLMESYHRIMRELSFPGLATGDRWEVARILHRAAGELITECERRGDPVERGYAGRLADLVALLDDEIERNRHRYDGWDEGDLFRSDRDFQVWTYTVSHGRLLLRSTKEDASSTRIDVYFGGVGRMLLWPDYRGLRIAEAAPPALAEYRDAYGEVPDGYWLFTLGSGLSSFVVAGVMQWHEDDGSYRDPSYFGHFLGA